jgi:hypothetical protein
MDRALDFGSSGCGFESRLGRYQIREILLRISLFVYIWGVILEPFKPVSTG